LGSAYVRNECEKDHKEIHELLPGDGVGARRESGSGWGRLLPGGDGERGCWSAAEGGAPTRVVWGLARKSFQSERGHAGIFPWRF
jgi:hypothetical protein